MSAAWTPCGCGHRKDGHDPLKDGGACRHPGCECRNYRRPARVRITAPPGQPRVARPPTNSYDRT